MSFEDLGGGPALPGEPTAEVVVDQPKTAAEVGAAAAAEAEGVDALAEGSDDMELLGKTDKIVVEQRAKFSEACCGYEGERK